MSHLNVENFKFKDECIRLLNLNTYSINTYQKLEEFMTNSEIISKRFFGEVKNNKQIVGPNDLYLCYLSDIKNEFISYFNSESLQDTSENNLIYYFDDYVKYSYKFSEEENGVLSNMFKKSISEIAAKSFEHSTSDFLGEGYKFRNLGSLPYTKFSHNYKAELIDTIVKNGFTEEVHKNVDTYYNPADIPNNEIKHLIMQLLIYDVEQVKSQFLWLLVGFLCSKIEQIKNQTAGMEKYFRDHADIKKILDALSSDNIIDKSNIWIGVKIQKAQRGSVYEQLDSSRSAIVSLIECLWDKGYLLPGDKTSMGKAFANSFKIKISDRQLRNLPTSHTEFYNKFDKIILSRN